MGSRAPQSVSLVRLANVQRVGVRLRVDGHRLDAHLLAGAHNPAGDFAPVCYEYLANQSDSLLGVRTLGAACRGASGQKRTAPKYTPQP